MRSYIKLVKDVLADGVRRPNRTGVDTISVFGTRWEHDMRKGFPLLTTKKVNYKACIHELLWFLSGNTNIKYLNDHGVHIWDAWADENGDLGPVYGKQWVDFGPNHVNQVEQLIQGIRHNPYDRRHIICAWNPSDMPEMALPPCHVLYQFYPDPNSRDMDLQVYMRSADLFLGVPFDIAEGALLLSMVAATTGYTPRKLIYVFGDTHVYVNHVEPFKIQFARPVKALPQLRINKKPNIFDYRFGDFEIVDYKHGDPIKAAVAV